MTENEATAEAVALARTAYEAFGTYLAGENVTFGCGIPFTGLPAAVQAGFLQVPDAILTAVAPKEAPSTVTVATPDGAEVRYQAADYALDGMALHLLAEKGKEDSAFASFAHGQWAHAESDGSRVPSGPDHAGKASALTAALHEVLDVVADEQLTRDQRLAEVQATTAKALRAHGAR